LFLTLAPPSRYEELATPYYAFKAKGYDVDLISPAGGPVPIDPTSATGQWVNEPVARFMADKTAQIILANSIPLADVAPSADEFVSGYDAMYMPGGHGACEDFLNNEVLIGCINAMYAAGKPVVTVCHGPICLVNCTKPDGTPLVEGLEVTGFTDSEERAVKLETKVPVLIEAKFRELGAEFSGGADWAPNTCVAGNLITGQNPASSAPAAEAMIAVIEKSE